VRWPKVPEGYAVRDDPLWGWLLFRVRGETFTQVGGIYDFRWVAVLAARDDKGKLNDRH